ncbi:MAG: HAMP domain-containing histidine kinase [Cryobacterium sp.]|nr:HAMP domain-containing histidine kinase [Oligoflexia bacterium]
MIKVLILLIAMSFCGHAFAAHDSEFTPGSGLLTWVFIPEGSDSRIPVLDSGPLWRQIPKNIQCCIGSYEAKIPGSEIKRFFQDTKINDPAFMVPGIPGLKKIIVNSTVEFVTSGDYSKAGPVIRLRDFKDFTLRLEIDSPRAIFTGLSYSRLRFGSFDQLLGDREGLVVREKYIPLFLFALFSLIAIVLFCYRIPGDTNDRLIYGFVEASVLWAIFYFSLSGLLRFWFPVFGSYAHLALRSFAGISSIRLLLRASEIGDKLIRKKTKQLSLVVVFCTAAVIVTDYRVQLVAYLIVNFVFCWTVFVVVSERMRFGPSSPVGTSLIAASILLSIGTILDSAKIIAEFYFVIRFSYPYMNRYLDPPLILTSIIYLASKANTAAAAEQKGEFVDRFTKQLLHDLRSPVAAFKNLLEIQNRIGMDAEVYSLAVAATKQISNICSSLEESCNSKYEQPILDLLQIFREQVEIKKIEYPQKNIRFHSDVVLPVTMTISSSEICRVISNLLNNAVEACEFDAIIKVESKILGKWLITEISDNGPGISEEAIKGFNTHGFVSSGNRSGLGLFHALKTVKSFGGELEIKNGILSGTIVSVKLPL